MAFGPSILWVSQLERWSGLVNGLIELCEEISFLTNVRKQFKFCSLQSFKNLSKTLTIIRSSIFSWAFILLSSDVFFRSHLFDDSFQLSQCKMIALIP